MVNRQGSLENMGMNQFGDSYRGKKILLTGHTGFKGSWLSLWLYELGACVTGISMTPQSDLNHWNLLKLQNKILDHRLDIRNFGHVLKVFQDTEPEIVFHLAAQPLVRRSYGDPLETWSTNVMGTANVLEACRQTDSVRSIVVITTDKCYENNEWDWGYRENDRLGGHDPYSASKASAELLAASYRSAFFPVNGAPLLATARAGNVIGGGDWSEDRLIPDAVRSMITQHSLVIRAPQATRPWQHVLESLSGYLLLGEKLMQGDRSFQGAWNFGPEKNGNRTVAEVLNKLSSHWPSLNWHLTPEVTLHEAGLLYLDSSKAHNKLGWQPVWNFDNAIEKTVDWYSAFIKNKSIISQQQLAQYFHAAKTSQAGWIQA